MVVELDCVNDPKRYAGLGRQSLVQSALSDWSRGTVLTKDSPGVPGWGLNVGQEPITRSIQIPYSICEMAFSQVELLLDIKAFIRSSSQ